MIQQDITNEICAKIDCKEYLPPHTTDSPMSYLYLAMQFRNIFTFFSPSNPLNLSKPLVEKWL